ncbi:hypothetical protein GCM10027280_28260 [Micromonospora polyrhachis]|uniref:Uncharacterized protein n=1 Tax=Micromonospora polyrhachis TaxID=1282883 RepID=A0A7W7WQD9_9ACTN|nr:hypothetical protein [Micromonospora polyrhachis]MBB4959193.1 hypothetical protein [Micromonospora polyrhachis]
MNLDLVALLAITALWLAAGIVAEGLPRPATARAMRRRTGWLAGLTLTGLVGLAVLGTAALTSQDPVTTSQNLVTTRQAPTDAAMAGLALPVVPAAVVALGSVRRLRRLWTGATAFASAPGTPTAPALTAGAAHPMIALPIQITGLATLPVAATAADLLPLTGPNLIGLVLTGAVLVVATIGVRHALRHSRLTEAVVTVRPRSPRAAGGVLHV